MSISSGSGFSRKLEHPPVLVAADEPVGARVVDRVEGERDDGAGLVVLALKRGQVEVGEHVSVEDQEAVREQSPVGREAQRATGAERLVLLDVGDRRAAGDLVAERSAQVLGAKAAGHHHLADPVAAEPVDHVADERAVDEGNRGLRLGQGQGPQPRALTPDQDERLHQSCSPDAGPPGVPIPS